MGKHSKYPDLSNLKYLSTDYENYFAENGNKIFSLKLGLYQFVSGLASLFLGIDADKTAVRH